MKKLPIYNYLDLSTAHITQETDEYLRKQAQEDEAYKAVVYEKRLRTFCFCSGME